MTQRTVHDEDRTVLLRLALGEYGIHWTERPESRFVHRETGTTKPVLDARFDGPFLDWRTERRTVIETDWEPTSGTRPATTRDPRDAELERLRQALADVQEQRDELAERKSAAHNRITALERNGNELAAKGERLAAENERQEHLLDAMGQDIDRLQATIGRVRATLTATRTAAEFGHRLVILASDIERALDGGE